MNATESSFLTGGGRWAAWWRAREQTGRLLDLDHQSHFDLFDRAQHARGKKLVIDVRDHQHSA